MYLKKIIVCGFKSFVDRTSLTLEKDRISGIVGPNGSGKSNIIDAVRWVMGEQNTKLLRGEKATDIIFSGSKGRKPVGMAEVTLVFDNGESSTFCPPEYRHELEIGLTRRLYSNGEREYLINKKQCRLKDMIDFFVSSGLGGKSYSMIQQGQVDRILQAKPEELREIVEEASGTASYKKRRNDALKKLEDTRISLSRIDDILKELDRQLVGLQEHVDKANKWKELSNEIREKEIHFLSQSYFFSKTHKKSLESELSSFDKVESENLSRIAKFEAEHQILQNKLDEADPEIRALSEKIAVAREQFATKETTLANTRSRLEEWGHRVYSLRQEVDEDGQRVQQSGKSGAPSIYSL